MNVKHQQELDEDVTLPEVFEEVNSILEKHNITRQRSQVMARPHIVTLHVCAACCMFTLMGGWVSDQQNYKIKKYQKI